MSVGKKYSFVVFVAALSLVGCGPAEKMQHDVVRPIQPSATGSVDIPKNFTAPIYPGSIAKFIYGPADPTKTNEELTVILQTVDDAEKVASFYKKELPKHAWKVAASAPTAEGIGISASNPSQLLKIEISDNVDSRMISLTVAAKK